jgi:hypothetical protein
MMTEGNGLHFQTLKFEWSVVRFTVSENTLLQWFAGCNEGD